MKRKYISILLSIVLIIVTITSLVACGENSDNKKVDKEHKEIIEKSIDAITDEWARCLNERDFDNKEIKIANTIVYELKKDFKEDDFKEALGDKYSQSYYDRCVQIFGEVDYIVEFVILVDYYGSGYSREFNLYNNCLVMGNDYEVHSHIIDQLFGATYIAELPFIERAIDYGSAFDRTIDLSK